MGKDHRGEHQARGRSGVTDQIPLLSAVEAQQPPETPKLGYGVNRGLQGHATPVSATVRRFTVYGVAQPQGSIKAFQNKASGRIQLTSTNPQVKPWRSLIQSAAFDAYRDDDEQRLVWFPDGAVTIVINVWLPKPPSVPKKRYWPKVKPDIDKLARSCLDALSGLAFRDDGQCCSLTITKRYAPAGEMPHTTFQIDRLED